MKIYETLKIEKSTKRALKVFAAVNGLTLSEAVSFLLEQAGKSSS